MLATHQMRKVFIFNWFFCPGAGYNGLKTAMIYAKVPPGLDETWMSVTIFFSRNTQHFWICLGLTPLFMAHFHFPLVGLGARFLS